jgi:hypothetical protein
VMDPSEYARMLQKLSHIARMDPVAPDYFAKLVQDAVEYARGIGFFPHPDFGPAGTLLAGIDTSACTERFEFGKDGKPFYVQGPNDSNAKAAAIAARVRAAGGHNSLVMDDANAIGLTSADEFDPDEDDDSDPNYLTGGS